VCPQKAEDAPTILHDVQGSIRHGCDWLADLIDPAGRIADSHAAALYYKVPAAFALNGDLRRAHRSLTWIAEHLIGPTGALAVPSDQPEGRAYDRGWLVWGASLCGRYDLALKLAADLAAFQHTSTGGFWDSRRELDESRGTHHAMTVGMAGWGLLSAGRVEEARRAAEFLLHLLERQPGPRDRIDLTVTVSTAGEQALAASQNPSDFVNCQATRQRPARIGPAQVLLVRLFQLLGERRYLDGAWAYTRIFVDGPDGMYDCVEAHKFMWGLVELQQVSPDPRLSAAADRAAAYIVSRQQPDGQWWGDAIGGGNPGQSLELRLNTTCNALVGLAAYRDLAPRTPLLS
jgi:hypothetical protein